jgi:hypothetical protein
VPALIGIKADKSKRCKVTFPAKVRAIAGEPQMKTTKPLMMIVVLTFLSVMSPLSAVAQRGPGAWGVELAPRGGARVVPQRLQHSPLRTHTFGAHACHGRLAWRQGRWHHVTRNGRNGWWWDVDGVWYFYPEQLEGPADYVSDLEVADNATTEDADEATTTSSPPTPPKAHFVFYYRPGDLLGTRYQTFEECSQVRKNPVAAFV